jgi:hypothetical protein
MQHGVVLKCVNFCVKLLVCCYISVKLINSYTKLMICLAVCFSLRFAAVIALFRQLHTMPKCKQIEAPMGGVLLSTQQGEGINPSGYSGILKRYWLEPPLDKVTKYHCQCCCQLSTSPARTEAGWPIKN